MAKMKLTPRKKGIQDRAKGTVDFIIEAATQILNEHGLKGFSTNKIVERAGVSIGTLYQYFPNKESIIQHLIEKIFTNMADDMVAVISKLELNELCLEDAVDRIMDQFLSKHEEKKGFFQQFVISLVSIEHLKFMLNNDQRIVNVIKEKFIVYQNELKIEDWDRTIFMILYALKGIQFGVMFGEKSISRSDLKKEAKKLILGYLRS
jgi:AcrR family transcriptional regulator